MSWAARAAQNLLPLSRERFSLPLALGEWRYTGHFHDLEEPIETCQLCNHPDIRYQFEIANLHTRHRLLIGSECINRFGIVAMGEDGRALSAEETRTKVGKDRRKLVEAARKRRVINALVMLSGVDTGFNILSFIDYLQDRGAFTPKQLALLLWQLKRHDIDHRPQDFKLTIRRNREKEQLLSLDERALKRIMPCLTASQRNFLERGVARSRSRFEPEW